MYIMILLKLETTELGVRIVESRHRTCRNRQEEKCASKKTLRLSRGYIVKIVISTSALGSTLGMFSKFG